MNRNSRGVYLALLLLATAPALWMGGCRQKQEVIPAGSFRAVVEDIVDDRLLLVKQITITAPGRRCVTVVERGGTDQVFGEPDRKTGLMTARVMFVADLIKREAPSESTLRWMVRMKSGGATVGGPGLSHAGSAGALDDVLSLGLHSGIYPLGQDIELGQVQDRQLALRVD